MKRIAAAAMHASFAAGVIGSSYWSEDDHHVVINLAGQKVDESDPFVFHVAAAFSCGLKSGLLNAAVEICPDISNSDVTERLNRFKIDVEQIWWALGRRAESRLKRLPPFIREALYGRFMRQG